MKAAPFEYVRAGSIGEACEVLQREGDAVKVVAGGQSLIPMMAMRLVRPGLLLDINEISALKFIAMDGDAVRIGACTRQSVAERDEGLASRVPLLHVAQTLGRVGQRIGQVDDRPELPVLDEPGQGEQLLPVLP